MYHNKIDGSKKSGFRSYNNLSLANMDESLGVEGTNFFRTCIIIKL
jgi:hypothetical protein